MRCFGGDVEAKVCSHARDVTSGYSCARLSHAFACKRSMRSMLSDSIAAMCVCGVARACSQAFRALQGSVAHLAPEAESCV